EEAIDALREAGLLAMGVPSELGGGGASIAEVAAVQRELAHHCGSTALATAMHQHVVAFTAWRHRRGLPGAEATLRRVADDGIVLVSTGGADQTRPRGEAVKADGGYRVSGRKVFCSQSPAGTVMSTMFAFDDPEQGRRVLNMAVPLSGDGISVLDDWDTLGMRGTGSNSIVVEDVFVPEEKVLANRPHGIIDPPLQVIFSIAFPIISAVYLGIAEAAYQAALDAAAGRADNPLVQRQVGLMRHRLRVAGWALDGSLAAVGDDPTPSMETVAVAMAAKREIALAGVEVCDLAMEVAGGRAYYRGSVIERCYRDVRGAKLHPLDPELTLVHGGRLALGLPADDLL
ncbi:MAG TPA: acyl-CoA dehydrogenase family protein, partial [Aquihabitans sp.]|nr:acyl-CoA dehydrogenase family protein [Aquihabitans sp.]